MKRCWCVSAWAVICVWCLGRTLQGGHEARFSQEQRAYWAFQPVNPPSVPEVSLRHRVRTPIDAFVLERLEKQGLSLDSPAEKHEWLRRAKFDLLGLPPTPEEIERFIGDDSAGAYERLIDEFLASPHYGEAWGRHWLDLVRYAETAGFNADPLRPLAYKYRDYVIRAFNADTPYDRFIQEQIAGDELFPESEDALIATGYNVMWPDESNASDILLARQEALNDLTANVGSVFLGLSIGCAQCHDHKFDPILQTDFYQLQAFFAGIVPVESVPVGSHDALADYQRKLRAWLEETAAVRNELHGLESTAMAMAGREKRMKFPPIVLDAIDTPVEHRTAVQRQFAFWSQRQITVSDQELEAQWTTSQKTRRDELRQRRAELEKQKPQPPGRLAAWVGTEVQSEPPATHLLAGGGYQRPLQEAPPGFPVALVNGASNLAKVTSPRLGTSGRRTALAKWLSDPGNPLTARVMVNRIWQGHFGRGIVADANDFGTQTEPPMHPELLDWLASEFVARGWSIKEMHRLIMLSEVYRQSSHRRSAEQPDHHGMEVDPANTLYWSYPRRRLAAESVRDAMLAVCGELNAAMFGPGVQPELPPNFSARHGWNPSENEADRRRCSVYIHAKRNLPYPLLEAFDLPDMHESCARRAESTTAPQSLMLLNSGMILGYAESFAGRLLRDVPAGDLSDLVQRAYLLAFGREPTEEESLAAASFIREGQPLFDGEMTEEDRRKRALTDFCHALLNANEFIYVE